MHHLVAHCASEASSRHLAAARGSSRVHELAPPTGLIPVGGGMAWKLLLDPSIDPTREARVWSRSCSSRHRANCMSARSRRLSGPQACPLIGYFVVVSSMPRFASLLSSEAFFDQLAYFVVVVVVRPVRRGRAPSSSRSAVAALVRSPFFWFGLWSSQDRIGKLLFICIFHRRACAERVHVLES